MLRYCLIICLWLLWGACKQKEEPEEQTGTPVFEVTGNIDGADIGLTGGINNYYMATDYFQDPYSVYVFTGDMKRDNCTTCGPSLKISIRNYTTQFPFSIDSAYTPGVYRYYNQLSPIDSLYTVIYKSTSSGQGVPAISWDFGNAMFSTDAEAVIRYEKGGVYNISGTAFYASDNCNSTLTQLVFLTPTRVGKNIDFNINYLDTYNLMFNSIPVDAGASVSWSFGDGHTANGTIVSNQYSSGGLYKVCMVYIKGNDTMQYCKNVNTLDYTECKSNYTFNSSLTIDSFNLSKVIVEWKDETGTVYSSANMKQPGSSSFNIIHSEDYKANEKGQKTRQLSVQFNCTVSNGTTTHELKNMQGKIAVAYP